ncbi:hypothetical protein QJQ45_013223 [Haematococcus lacustris]|nr:hypothetical protein QJQ45_013223 [Haematococcus lacustris]
MAVGANVASQQTNSDPANRHQAGTTVVEPRDKAAHTDCHAYEFFGPHVPAALIVVLPLVLYGLVYACNSQGCLQLYPSLSIPGFPPDQKLWSTEAFAVYLGWVLGLALLHRLLPGRSVQGVVLPNGTRLTYKLNAFPLFVSIYSIALILGFGTQQLPLGWLYDHYLELLSASVVVSSSLGLALWLASFRPGVMLSGHGNSGWPWYDCWMGRELNPRLWGVDLKEFCELYPGMIGWALLNLGLAHKQWTDSGSVTTAIILLYYVVDALWNEASILTTMDITTDGFGYMLAFGDLAWVPFVFSTSTRFLVDTPQALSPAFTAAILGVKLLGYWIFRGANGQKDAFRRDPSHPSVAHLRTLPTERGTRLIISGWWGASRHINYLGDWIMGLSWCLPCGLDGLKSVLPYMYCIYFAVLLVHRERRDDMACRAKYGKDWDKYRAIVKYRIIPYVY